MQLNFINPFYDSGITYCFRLIGPTLGYLLASGCLKLFINPLLNPVIENNDPRWIGK